MAKNDYNLKYFVVGKSDSSTRAGVLEEQSSVQQQCNTSRTEIYIHGVHFVGMFRHWMDANDDILLLRNHVCSELFYYTLHTVRSLHVRLHSHIFRSLLENPNCYFQRKKSPDKQKSFEAFSETFYPYIFHAAIVKKYLPTLNFCHFVDLTLDFWIINVSVFCRASCRILLFMNSAVNVFIYAGRLAAFRKSIKNDFTKIYNVLCTCATERFGMKHSESVSSNRSSAQQTEISHAQNWDFNTSLWFW